MSCPDGSQYRISNRWCVGKVTGLVNQWGRYTCWPVTESVQLRPEAEIQAPHTETGCCRTRTGRDVAKQKATPTDDGLGAGGDCECSTSHESTSKRVSAVDRTRQKQPRRSSSSERRACVFAVYLTDWLID